MKYYFISFIMVRSDGVPSWGQMVIKDHPVVWLKDIHIQNRDKQYVLTFWKELSEKEALLAQQAAAEILENQK